MFFTMFPTIDHITSGTGNMKRRRTLVSVKKKPNKVLEQDMRPGSI
jgi:hypothetical protein